MVKELCLCLVNKGLPLLQTLDLRANAVGDGGARYIAHTVLSGGQAMVHLRRLLLQHNHIQDNGGLALFKVVCVNGEQRGICWWVGSSSHAGGCFCVCVCVCLMCVFCCGVVWCCQAFNAHGKTQVPDMEELDVRNNRFTNGCKHSLTPLPHFWQM